MARAPREWIEQFGGRRFLAAMVGGAGTWVLALTGHITPDAYQWTTLGIIGAYITGNTTQKVKGPPDGPPAA